MLEKPVFELPKLYGISSTGKVKEWKIYVQWLNDNRPWITTEYGYLNGEIQTTSTVVKEGKNIGRSNETTPYEQACSEAKSKWLKKKDENYQEQIPTASSIILLPMLAQKYNDKKHVVKWPWYGQQKFNGIRSLAKIENGQVIFTSRKGKKFTTFSHIEKELLEVFPEGSILDGEIFHPDLTLQSIVSRVKREKTSRIDLEDIKLEYWIYDTIMDAPFRLRTQYLSGFSEVVQSTTQYITLAETTLLASENDLLKFNEYNLDKGFEGSMLRNPLGLYRPDYRSPDLLKFKDFTFQNEEFEIVGGVSAKGKDNGTVVFICKTKDGKEFSVRPKGTREQRMVWLNEIDSLIGKELTVKFAEYTPDGIPFHPSGVVIRDYE